MLVEKLTSVKEGRTESLDVTSRVRSLLMLIKVPSEDWKLLRIFKSFFSVLQRSDTNKILSFLSC